MDGGIARGFVPLTPGLARTRLGLEVLGNLIVMAGAVWFLNGGQQPAFVVMPLGILLTTLPGLVIGGRETTRPELLHVAGVPRAAGLGVLGAATVVGVVGVGLVAARFLGVL